jgi:asparagine synthase (glutamine-hydrolysing)
MSAIYGIINKNGAPVDMAELLKMKQAIIHRVKDGASEWIGDNAGFGCCHMIVYPGQENEKLPLETGDLVFTANAHLTNRDELLQKLQLDKKQFETTPDSYIILEAFKKWAGDCVHQLEGDYVFAAWNKVSKELFIATDHIGFKPLYYYDTTDRFVFCSEIKGIEAVKTTTNYFDEQSLVECFFKNGDPRSTYNKEIKRLCGGNTLQLSGTACSINKYWSLDPTGKYHFKSFQECAENVREMIFNAVTRRLNPERPIGITLSGGLDSSSVACMLSAVLQKKNKPLYAFSSVQPAAFKNAKRSERHYIEAVGKHCPNLVQEYVTAEERGPFDDLEKAFDHDESFSNIFHYMDDALRQAAAKKNVGILYSGFGGDFLVSKKGSEVIYRAVNDLRFRTAWQLLKKMRSKQDKSLWNVLRSEYITYTPAARFYRKSTYLRIEDYLQPGLLKRQKWYDTTTNEGTARVISSGKAGEWVGMQDNSNAFYGISTATPLFDKNIAELLTDIPEEYFVHEGLKRSVIRVAMEGILPKEIQWRTTKSPFVVNYEDRIIRHSPRFRDIFSSTPVLQRYIRTEAASQLMDDIVLNKPINLRTELRYNRAGLLVSAAVLLLYVENKKYHFSFD